MPLAWWGSARPSTGLWAATDPQLLTPKGRQKRKAEKKTNARGIPRTFLEQNLKKQHFFSGVVELHGKKTPKNGIKN
jgi:hypothetical protein